MDIRLAVGSISSYGLRPDSRIRNAFNFNPYCSRKDSKGQPRQNGNNNNNNKNDERNGGDKFSTDWDKAWSVYRKQGKKTLFSQFSDKYVSWNPRRSDYPLSEEVDPIKRTEKSNLKLWTSRSFTLGGAIVIVTFLLIYTILYPINNFCKYGEPAVIPIDVVFLSPIQEFYDVRFGRHYDDSNI